MSFAELFSEAPIADEVVPGLLEYYREPTLARARVLLGALGVSVPYDALGAMSKATRALLRAQSAAASGSRGGGSRRGRRGRSVAPESAAPPDYFAIHRCLDMIHDLKETAQIRAVLDHVLSQAPNMPPEVAGEIRALLDAGATNAALVALAERLGDLRRAGPPIQLELRPEARESVLRADYAFARLVARWLRRPTLEIALDNVFREPIPPPKRLRGDAKALAALNTPEAARTLALCAFLQLVLGGPCASAGNARLIAIRARDEARLRPTVREVRFLVGTFQTLDVGGYEAFLKRWVHALRAESAHFYTLSEANFTYETISVADAAAAAAARAGDREGPTLAEKGLHVRGLYVPYRSAAAPAAPAAPASAPPEQGARAFLARFRDAGFQTAYKKDWLRRVHLAYNNQLAPRDRARRDVRDFMAAVFDVNAFRDALRADVALARGAVFITGDHLAFAYYAKRAEALGAPREGFSLEANGIGDLNARFYESAPGPSESAGPSGSASGSAAT